MISNLDGLLPFKKLCKFLFEVGHESFEFGLLSEFFKLFQFAIESV